MDAHHTAFMPDHPRRRKGLCGYSAAKLIAAIAAKKKPMGYGA
jgi:hypothetical protein